MDHDKRQFTRTPCEIESTFSRMSESAAFSETLLQDISEGGARFRAYSFIPVRDRLLVRIRIPHQKTIEAVAEPTWVREIPSLNQYDIGVKFLSLSESDRQIIRQFAQNSKFLTFGRGLLY
jgi:c-di-GMP-binding flagellar brake protein YcgR